jgi:Protein of unknown function (DUF1232)
VPDFIPVAGQLDDLVVVAIVFRSRLHGSGEPLVRTVEHYANSGTEEPWLARLVLRLQEPVYEGPAFGAICDAFMNELGQVFESLGIAFEELRAFGSRLGGRSASARCCKSAMGPTGATTAGRPERRCNVRSRTAGSHRAARLQVL